MMDTQHTQFATALAAKLAASDNGLYLHPEAPHKVLIEQKDGQISLDLTPFEATPQLATATPYFEHVETLKDLLGAYREARRSMLFELDVPALSAHVHSYANRFLDKLFARAEDTLEDVDAQRIAAWVKNFDVYVAVKTVESLLNSKADLMLLELAEEKGWDVHFDHLAIRCGSAIDQAGEQVAALLCERHGYTPSQVQEERTYRFPDGWSAYPLYKILENGQMLRLFIDESDGSDPAQVIQHWNRVYGYTAHHLAIRATRRENHQRVAVSLDEIAAALAEKGISIMTPTGKETHGLLVQVFTKPEWNPKVPREIKQELSTIAPGLETTIKNGKLLELLSRREALSEFVRDYFTLYGLSYDQDNPLHSVPCYQYFLPAQAAHVIRTSVETWQVQAS